MTARPPRTPLRSEIKPEDLGAYDKVVERGTGQVFDPLLNAPQMCYHLSGLASAARSSNARGGMTYVDREWIDMVNYYDLGRNDFGLEFHLNDAVAHGIKPEAIKALRTGHDEELDEVDHTLTSYIRKVREGKVTDEDYAFVEKRMGVQGAVEFTIFVMFNVMMMRLDQALKLSKSRGWSDEKILMQLESWIEGPRPTELKIKLS